MTDDTVLLSPGGAAAYILAFATGVLLITWFFGRRVGSKSIEGFLLANRDVRWLVGGPSIAASWTWAVALMISVQMAYEDGFGGLFWFTVPNIIAVLIFVWLGPQIRRRFPHGYSLPEWIHERYGSRSATGLYLFVYVYYQVMAATVQIYAGGHLLAAATGLSVMWLMPVVVAIVLLYTVISGLEASIVTDVVQLALMLLIGGAIVLGVVGTSGPMRFDGIGGQGGMNPFSPGIALTAGVITSIGLLSGSIGDQQFWQRCLAMRKGDVRRSFVLGAILFAAIPIGLSVIGFKAAGANVLLPEGTDSSMIGFIAVKEMLPKTLAALFLLVLLAGLSSTLDSALAASSSLYRLVHQGFWRDNERKKPFSMARARLAMLVVAGAGLGLAYAVEFLPGFGLKYLWWFLNTVGACVVVPTILSLFWRRLTASGILRGSGVGLIVGLPLVVWASITGNDWVLAASYAGIVAVSASSCIVFRAGRDDERKNAHR